MCPAKTQISLRESSYGTLWTAKDPKRLYAERKDCLFAQANLSHRWAYMQSCRKYCVPTHMLFIYFSRVIMHSFLTYSGKQTPKTTCPYTAEPDIHCPPGHFNIINDSVSGLWEHDWTEAHADSDFCWLLSPHDPFLMKRLICLKLQYSDPTRKSSTWVTMLQSSFDF